MQHLKLKRDGMDTLEIFKIKSLCGEIQDIPPDKSLSHRACIFSLLSNKPSRIKNYLNAADTLSSLAITLSLGAEMREEEDSLILYPPKERLREPDNVLECGNSGTSMRLFAGLLAGYKGYFVLTGDKYLRLRPMNRIILPLREMGCDIYARKDGLAPLTVLGGGLRGIQYHSPIASAQIKSALILAGLRADSRSIFREPELSRDHSERMILDMGGKITYLEDEKKANKFSIDPVDGYLYPLDIHIPSDPSSAFFLALAATLLKNSQVLLKNVLLNPTRIEAFEVLRKMGAKIEYVNLKHGYEPIGDILVSSSELNGITLSENIAWLIDEIPGLSIAMACAKGRSVVKGAKELRVKECDRIQAIVKNLLAMGIECREFADGFEIQGGELRTGLLDSFGDHRIAMSFGIASLLCGGKMLNPNCTDVSFPNFWQIIQKYKVD